jgi:monothiol glutaredoxin
MHRSDDNPFKIAATPESDQARGMPVSEVDQSAAPADRIRSWVNSSDIFLLIKGTPQRPLCGFSANTVAIIDSLDLPYRTFDVLSDESIREAAKIFAGWPTFPQIYIKGEFVGGNDILTEMYEAGELRELVSGVGA